MLARRCHAITERGEPCQQAPLRDREHCFWHDPENAAEAAEARRLGGLRRRRENTLLAAYGIEGLDAVTGARRLLEIAVTEALSLDNSLARSRLLVQAAYAAARLVEVGELEDRVRDLEAALGPRLASRWRQ